MKPIIKITFLLSLSFIVCLNAFPQWKIYEEEVETGLIKGGNITVPLCEDEMGNLWASTTKGDILRFKDEKWTIYSDEKVSLLAQTNVGEIANAKTGSYVKWMGVVDKNGKWVWFGSNKAVMLWNGEELLTVTGSLDEENRMIFQSGETGKNYIIKEGELIAYKETNLPKGKPVIRIKIVYRDQENRIWFGEWKGELYCIDNGIWSYHNDIKEIENQKNSPKGNNDLSLMFEDSKGNFWIALNNCILKKSGAAFTIEQEVGATSSVFEDSKGNLWFGYGRGILQYSKGSWTKFEESNGLEEIKVGGRIYEDEKGNIWYCAALNPFNFKNGNIYVFDGNSWSSRGVDQKNKIFDLYRDSRDNFWVAGADGIYKFKNNAWSLEKESPGSTNILSIFEDSQGDLWFGTGSFKGKIVRYTPDN
jgi:ligand-binding sensor domain-containing protein